MNCYIRVHVNVSNGECSQVFTFGFLFEISMCRKQLVGEYTGMGEKQIGSFTPQDESPLG